MRIWESSGEAGNRNEIAAAGRKNGEEGVYQRGQNSFRVSRVSRNFYVRIMGHSRVVFAWSSGRYKSGILESWAVEQMGHDTNLMVLETKGVSVQLPIGQKG